MGFQHFSCSVIKRKVADTSLSTEVAWLSTKVVWLVKGSTSLCQNQNPNILTLDIKAQTWHFWRFATDFHCLRILTQTKNYIALSMICQRTEPLILRWQLNINKSWAESTDKSKHQVIVISIHFPMNLSFVSFSDKNLQHKHLRRLRKQLCSLETWEVLFW